MIVKKRVFLSFVLILITQLLMTSQSKYYTYLNDFSDFRNNSNKIVNNVLVETNNFNEAQFNLINYNCDNAEISIAMRIANKNNIYCNLKTKRGEGAQIPVIAPRTSISIPWIFLFICKPSWISTSVNLPWLVQMTRLVLFAINICTAR